ncbi:MAG: hypothetical protein JO334_13875 [Verrucomicrobia bacterium]|nr:hypothetical protein [Verrucomicrobiota bacterium]
MTVYDSDTDHWVTLTPMPTGRHAIAAATVGHVAYFAAGALACGDGYDILFFSADLPILTLP